MTNSISDRKTAATARSVSIPAIVLSLAILVLWSFPRFWYTKTDSRQGTHWFAEQALLPGWQFKAEPVSAEAEQVLAADRIVNGAFVKDDGTVVRAFSAKRYSEKESEFDMFSHTPDRCWTSVGWKVEPAAPEFIDLNVAGLTLKLERRLFNQGGRRELVYFGALVGGQPLPYRLDQYLSVGLKRNEQTRPGIFTKMIGALDARLLSWPWKSFVNRRPLTGPKQFVRVSTPVVGNGIAEADATLKNFLPQWLALADYEQELRAWQRR